MLPQKLKTTTGVFSENTDTETLDHLFFLCCFKDYPLEIDKKSDIWKKQKHIWLPNLEYYDIKFDVKWRLKREMIWWDK